MATSRPQRSLKVYSVSLFQGFVDLSLFFFFFLPALFSGTGQEGTGFFRLRGTLIMSAVGNHQAVGVLWFGI